jgi:hypothetical protein
MGIELEVILCGCYDQSSTIKRLESNLKVITTGFGGGECVLAMPAPNATARPVQTVERMEETCLPRLGADSCTNAGDMFARLGADSCTNAGDMFATARCRQLHECRRHVCTARCRQSNECRRHVYTARCKQLHKCRRHVFHGSVQTVERMQETCLHGYCCSSTVVFQHEQ